MLLESSLSMWYASLGTVITDRGTQFAGHFFPAVAALLDTQSRLTSAYHPQTDGQTERVNRVLEDMLRSFVNAQQTNWDLLSPLLHSLLTTLSTIRLARLSSI